MLRHVHRVQLYTSSSFFIARHALALLGGEARGTPGDVGCKVLRGNLLNCSKKGGFAKNSLFAPPCPAKELCACSWEGGVFDNGGGAPPLVAPMEAAPRSFGRPPMSPSEARQSEIGETGADEA